MLEFDSIFEKGSENRTLLAACDNDTGGCDAGGCDTDGGDSPCDVCQSGS